jgi:hypothetical protein
MDISVRAPDGGTDAGGPQRAEEGRVRHMGLRKGGKADTESLHGVGNQIQSDLR